MILSEHVKKQGCLLRLSLLQDNVKSTDLFYLNNKNSFSTGCIKTKLKFCLSTSDKGQPICVVMQFKEQPICVVMQFKREEEISYKNYLNDNDKFNKISKFTVSHTKHF